MAKIKAPKVQSLGSIMSELAPAYQKQQGVIQQRQAGLQGKYDSQRAGIRAERGEGFNAINDQATGRGMSFSGIPMDEQARYLSTKYLPAMQMADYQQNEEDLALQGEMADIYKEQRTTAFGERSTQKGRLADWRSARKSAQEQAAEAARQRRWQARQDELQRNFTAGQNAADRAASAAQYAQSSQDDTVSLYDDIQSKLMAAAGPKGYVSVGAWKNLAAYAKSKGMSFAGKNGFANSFWNYANNSQWKKYKNGYNSSRYM